MGWYGEITTRGQKVAELIKSHEVKNDSGDLVAVTSCLKHCYRGNPFSGVLWSVWQRVLSNGETQFFIGCDLVKYQKPYWMHKPLDEGCGPFYYSCPLAYLAMVPKDKALTYNENWREGVKEYHLTRKIKREDKKRARQLAKKLV